MGRRAFYRFATVLLAVALTLSGVPPVYAQDEEIAQFRARTVGLFRELAQLRREEVIVFGVSVNAPRLPNFGAGNPRAHDWLQRTKRHLARAPQGMGCWDDLDLFVCDHELLAFVGAEYGEFHRLMARFWLLTVCTEYPQTCRPEKGQP